MREMNRIKFLLAGTLAAFGFIISSALTAEAAEYDNDSTGYFACVDDSADILSDEEEQALLKDMEPITAYSSVMFYSTDDSGGDAQTCANSYFDEYIGDGSNGTVFLVDIEDRQLYIWSDGEALRVVTGSYGSTITDNVYQTAHEGDYYGSASEAFSQILSLWEGQKISTPMKNICNALIAVVLALFINIYIMLFVSRSQKASDRALLSNIVHHCNISNVTCEYSHTTKTYDPKTDTDGGSGGGSFSGGGDSGGGGGHGF